MQLRGAEQARGRSKAAGGLGPRLARVDVFWCVWELGRGRGVSWRKARWAAAIERPQCNLAGMH